MIDKLIYIISIIAIILSGLIDEKIRTGAEWINILKAQFPHILFIIIFAIIINAIIKFIKSEK